MPSKSKETKEQLLNELASIDAKFKQSPNNTTLLNIRSELLETMLKEGAISPNEYEKDLLDRLHTARDFFLKQGFNCVGILEEIGLALVKGAITKREAASIGATWQKVLDDDLDKYFWLKTNQPFRSTKGELLTGDRWQLMSGGTTPKRYYSHPEDKIYETQPGDKTKE